MDYDAFETPCKKVCIECRDSLICACGAHRLRRRKTCGAPECVRAIALGRKPGNATPASVEAQVARLLREGKLTIDSIARRYGLSRSTVAKIRNRQGIVRKRSRANNSEALRLPDAVALEVVALYGRGASLKEIGDELGIAASTAGRALRRAGVTVRPRSCSSMTKRKRTQARPETAQLVALVRGGMTVSRAAAEVGIGKQAAYWRLAHCGLGAPTRPRITEDDVNRVREMIASGMSKKDVAAAIGRSPTTVTNWLKPRPKRPSERDAFPRLPSAPLVAYVHGLDASIERACARAGILPRTLFRWENMGERASFDMVDGILSRLGRMWWDVYDPQLAPDLFSPLEWIDVVDEVSWAFEGMRLIGGAA